MADGEHLSLGAVVKAAPLTYVEAWVDWGDVVLSANRHIYFDWTGMEPVIAEFFSVEAFMGRPVKMLRFSVPDGEGGVRVSGVWRR